MGSVRESGWIAALDGVAMESFSEELTLKIRPELTSRSQPRKKQRGAAQRRGNSYCKGPKAEPHLEIQAEASGWSGVWAVR